MNEKEFTTFDDTQARIEAAEAKYMRHAHRIQAGVAAVMHYDALSTTPKHMRTGIDMFKAEQGALARLLIAKGVFTHVEYMEAIADATEEEANRYEKKVQEFIPNARLGSMY